MAKLSTVIFFLLASVVSGFAPHSKPAFVPRQSTELEAAPTMVVYWSIKVRYWVCHRHWESQKLFARIWPSELFNCKSNSAITVRYWLRGLRNGANWSISRNWSFQWNQNEPRQNGRDHRQDSRGKTSWKERGGEFQVRESFLEHWILESLAMRKHPNWQEWRLNCGRRRPSLVWETCTNQLILWTSSLAPWEFWRKVCFTMSVRICSQTEHLQIH